MLVLRSLLFVPANRENMILRAHDTPADAVVLDLEDSVPPAEKAAARANLGGAIASLKAAGKTVHARVNHFDSGDTALDLDAAVVAGLDGLILPKAGAARDVRQLDVLLRQRELQRGLKPGNILLFPHIESARGLLRCEEIVQASTRIAGLSLGGEDFAADLGVPRTREGVELEHGRRVVVTCAAAYGLVALDSVFAAFNDEEGLLADARHARAIGFKGKYVIHPRQVEPVNEVFRPGADEIEAARRVVAAFEEATAQGLASVQVDGRMVDTPVAKRAKDLLAYAEAIEARATSPTSPA